MDYLLWSREYTEEAEKVLRNIEKLKKKVNSVKCDERQTVLKNIITLKGVYHELIETAGYLRKRAEESASNAA